MPNGGILDAYVHSVPSPQNAIDIFKGEWSSQFPMAYVPSMQAGGIPLFEDIRIIWAIQQLGGIGGQRILELGPLEGGHTYMLEHYGAESIVAIESNTRAYLKCLITKEILGLKRVKFLCGDFIEYLKSTPEQFDFILSSGVLYHMLNPVELLSLIAAHTSRIYLWTHYFDESIRSNVHLRHKYPSSDVVEQNGFRHTLYRQEYQVSLNRPGFCGGNEDFSNWLSRSDLLACLTYLGFKDVRVAHEMPDHPHGPCISVLAIK